MLTQNFQTSLSLTTKQVYTNVHVHVYQHAILISFYFFTCKCPKLISKYGHFEQQNVNMPSPQWYTLVIYSNLGCGTSKTKRIAVKHSILISRWNFLFKTQRARDNTDILPLLFLHKPSIQTKIIYMYYNFVWMTTANKQPCLPNNCTRILKNISEDVKYISMETG